MPYPRVCTKCRQLFSAQDGESHCHGCSPTIVPDGALDETIRDEPHASNGPDHGAWSR